MRAELWERRACRSTFAAWHIYLALRGAWPGGASVVLPAFASMLASTGIYHSVFIALNFGAKVSEASGGGPAEQLALSLCKDARS
jgi:hypothetical protein